MPNGSSIVWNRVLKQLVGRAVLSGSADLVRSGRALVRRGQLAEIEDVVCDLLGSVQYVGYVMRGVGNAFACRSACNNAFPGPRLIRGVAQHVPPTINEFNKRIGVREHRVRSYNTVVQKDVIVSGGMRRNFLGTNTARVGGIHKFLGVCQTHAIPL